MASSSACLVRSPRTRTTRTASARVDNLSGIKVGNIRRQIAAAVRPSSHDQVHRRWGHRRADTRPPCVAYARRARAMKARFIRARMQRRLRCIRASVFTLRMHENTTNARARKIHCVCTQTRCIRAGVFTLRMHENTTRVHAKCIAYARKSTAHRGGGVPSVKSYVAVCSNPLVHGGTRASSHWLLPTGSHPHRPAGRTR